MNLNDPKSNFENLKQNHSFEHLIETSIDCRSFANEGEKQCAQCEKRSRLRPIRRTNQNIPQLTQPAP